MFKYFHTGELATNFYLIWQPVLERRLGELYLYPKLKKNITKGSLDPLGLNTRMTTPPALLKFIGQTATQRTIAISPTNESL